MDDSSTITTQSLREGAAGGGDPMAALVVEVSDEERDRCALRHATKRRAAQLLHRAGVVVLKNAVPPGDVRRAEGEQRRRWQRLHAEFIAPYERAHASDVGPRRFKEVVTRGPLRYDMSHNVDFGDGDDAGGEDGAEDASGGQSPGAAAQLAELSVAAAVVRRCLGRRAIPFGSGCVFSLPGASEGPKHVDSPHLFDPRETGADVAALDEITAQLKSGGGSGGAAAAAAVARRAGAAFAAGALPAHHVNVFVPLIDLTEGTGATRFVPGSHRTHTGGWRGPAPPHASLYLDHFPAAGDVILFDCRLYHMGTANRSSLLRPILYCTWSVPWFKEDGYFGTRSLVEEMRRGLHGDALTVTLNLTPANTSTGSTEDTDDSIVAQDEAKAQAQAQAQARFEAFVQRHKQQLRSTGLPPSLWASLYRKLSSGVCDAGEALALTPQSQVGADAATDRDSDSDSDSDTGGCGGSGRDDDEKGDGAEGDGDDGPLALVTTRPLREFEDVWLLEHVWTFEQPTEAAMQMAWHPQLLPLACAALGLAYRGNEAAAAGATGVHDAVGAPPQPPAPPVKLAELADAADLPRDAEQRLRAVRVATDLVLAVAGSYAVAGGGGEGGGGGAVVRRFLLDTIGCHAQLNAAPCTDNANFVLSGAFVHFTDSGDGASVYSLLWPIEEATDAGTAVQCDCSAATVAGGSVGALSGEAWAHVASRVREAADGRANGSSET